MKEKRLRSVLMPGLALCLCSLPATAGNILFGDLAPTGTIYNDSFGGLVCGSAVAACLDESNVWASSFLVAGSGSEAVTEIDLAVGNVSGPNTFSAAIWTDSAGLPGTQVANADWNLSTSTPFGTCCGLVSITDIAGVTLTGGQQYFMIYSPLSLSDSSFNAPNVNNQGVTGTILVSVDGGAFCNSCTGDTVSDAFDILGTPEPATFGLVLLGTMALSIAAKKKRASAIRAGKMDTGTKDPFSDNKSSLYCFETREGVELDKPFRRVRGRLFYTCAVRFGSLRSPHSGLACVSGRYLCRGYRSD